MGQVKKNYATENKLVADIRYVNQKISIMEEITLATICFETTGEVGNKKGCKKAKFLASFRSHPEDRGHELIVSKLSYK